MVCLIIGILFRCAVAYGSVAFSKLNFKEKLFVCASWTPKATVQVEQETMTVVLKDIERV